MSDERDDIEQRLHEALRRSTPDPPPDGGRAEAARRYARHARRTKALSAIGAAAAVVAAVVVVPTVLLSGNDGGNVATGPTAALPTPHLAHPFRCPGPGHPATLAPPPANDVVPTGAVLVRLCTTGVGGWVSAGPVRQPAEGLATAPQEPLVTNVDTLVRDVNGLPVRKTPVACPLMARPVDYTLTFQYADGHAVSVHAETVGCELVTTGTVQRSGAIRLLGDYLALLDQQREHYAAPTGVSIAARCPTTGPTSAGTTIVVDHRHLGLRSATTCSYSFPGGNNPSASAALSSRQIQKLERDLATRSSKTPPKLRQRQCAEMRGETGATLVVGVDRWGNSVDLIGECAGFQMTDRSGTWYWTPAPATEQMLNKAVKVTEPPARGGIAGRLLAVGGPAGGAARPLPGHVQFARGKVVKSVTVGKTGMFKAALFPGRYRVVGHSPSYRSGTGACLPAHPYVTIHATRLIKVNVYCQEK